MNRLATRQRSILFMNNMAGDDFWEYGHLMLPNCLESATPHEWVNYKSSSKSGAYSQGLFLTAIPYEVGNTSVQLYGFPFLAMDVDPNDVEYPTQPIGIVITQDMRMLDYFLEQNPNFHHTANPNSSRLAWAKRQNLPTVLAVHHARKYRSDLDNLSRLVGMEIICPVIWQDNEPSAEFFSEAVNIIAQNFV